MKWKSLFLATTLQVLACALASVAFTQGLSLTPGASEIDRSASAALAGLYSQNAAARALGAKAKAVLVFPDIRKGAFIIGAQYGYGALRRGRKTIGYYRTGAASYGFQAGVKQFGYTFFL